MADALAQAPGHGGMKPITKVGLVLGGYVLAVLVALAVLMLYMAFTGGPDRDLYGGMYAFGDTMLFLWVFAVAATVPTGAALYFLRGYRSFWVVLAVVALAIAATAVAALIGEFAARGAAPGSGLAMWASYGVLRILVAPLFALAFFVSGVFAPIRGARAALL